MSDLYYDAHLTDDERRRLRDCAQISWGHLNAAVESILQARLLDLAQRAEAAEAAVERVRRVSEYWDLSEFPHEATATAMRSELIAALDHKEDQ